MDKINLEEKVHEPTTKIPYTLHTALFGDTYNLSKRLSHRIPSIIDPYLVLSSATVSLASFGYTFIFNDMWGLIPTLLSYGMFGIALRVHVVRTEKNEEDLNKNDIKNEKLRK